MLNGSALLRVLLVVIAAAGLTALVQHYWTFDNGSLETADAVARPAAPTPSVRRTDPAPARATVPTAPAPASSPPPATPAPAAPLPLPAAAPAPAAPPEARSAALAPSPPPAQPEPVSNRRPPPPAPVTTEPAAGEQEIAAAEAASPPAVGLVDLNTGTLQELNGLRGGGAIGRAIIQRRPYASVDQLITKRVLSRAIYQRIRDQVTVR